MLLELFSPPLDQRCMCSSPAAIFMLQRFINSFMICSMLFSQIYHLDNAATLSPSGSSVMCVDMVVDKLKPAF